MKRLFIILSILVLLLTGCTPTSKPDMTLEQAAYQEGDLPEGYEKGEVRKTVAESFQEIVLPAAKDSIYLTLQSSEKMGDSNRGGNINILLFKNAADMETAYDQLSNVLLGSTGQIDTVTGLGEQSAMTRFELKPVVFTNVAFSRCNAVVYLLLTDEEDVAVSYLKKVDERLKKSVCP